MIGDVLQDKYRIEKKLKRGGFATVYRGLHEGLKRQVAVKILHEDSSQDAQRRFVRESERMAQMSHENIVSIFDYGHHDGHPFLVMEYIEGPTLLELANRDELTIEQVCHLAKQVCHGMAYAHGRGIIHRDLSLNNVMVDGSPGGKPVAKVLDFGLLKDMNDSFETTGNLVGGTYPYIAPEILRAEQIDERVDIFSFGVCLFRLTNGQFPFNAQHKMAVAYLILAEDNLNFSDDCPPGMMELIRSCLEKDPTRRTHSFEAVGDKLDMVLMETASTAKGARSVRTLDVSVERHSRQNPYLNRVMIQNPHEFFGRIEEVATIYSRVDATHPQSVSVVGERRIGKSSLLNYICHRRNRETRMTHRDSTIFAFLDFQSDAHFNVPKFISFLFNAFTFELSTGGTLQRGEDFTTVEPTLDKLKEVIAHLDENGKRVIVLMDEFEVITSNEEFPENFFSYLRSLAMRYKVAYVTSSRAELQTLCHSDAIAFSPFFNIFSNLPLGPLKRDEAIQLITQPSEREGVPLAEHADEILYLAGPFPLFLQIACSTVFEKTVANPLTELKWDDIQKTFMQQVEPHYDFVWKRMEPAERENLMRIAAGKSANKRTAFANEELEKHGYIQKANGGFEVCSSSLKLFIEKQVAREKGGRKGLFRLFGRG